MHILDTPSRDGMPSEWRFQTNFELVKALAEIGLLAVRHRDLRSTGSADKGRLLEVSKVEGEE